MVEICKKHQELTLTPDQDKTLLALLDFAAGHAKTSLAVLEGFAGTGKTTVVGRLLNGIAMSLRVAVAAPTNKALAVLESKVSAYAMADVEFKSIHSFLGMRLKELDDGSQLCEVEGRATLHEYDLAIIDECSMISAAMFEQILRAKRTCRVLFVGDPAQLPPVEDKGANSPVFSMVGSKYRLTEVIRQARDNPIIALSMATRAAIDAGRRMGVADVVAALPSTTPCAAGVVAGGEESIVASIVREAGAGRQCRALAWRNATVNRINARTHALLYPKDVLRFSPGEAVIAQNEFKSVGEAAFQEKRIFNSEEMTVESSEQCIHAGVSATRLVLRRDDGSTVLAYVADDDSGLQRQVSALFAHYRAASEKHGRHSFQAKNASSTAWSLRKQFAPLRHTYAMTAHKSQGSTFGTVLVHWDDLMGQRSDFEFNRMFYVAITRAANYMAVVTS